MPGFLDHLLLALIAVALPFYGTVTWKSFQRQLLEGKQKALLHAYWETMILQWSLFLLLLLIWSLSERPHAALGFSVTWNLKFVAGILLALAGSGFFIKQWLDLERLEGDIPETLKHQVESVAALMPHTEGELKSFIGVSITAGICEEALYRGFLIWYLGNYVGILHAALISVLVFGLAHAYQGKDGMLKTSAMGLVLAIIYVLSGSLLGPVLIHIVTDVTGGLIGRRIVQSMGK